MALYRRGDIWWYEFWFAGRHIQESSKSSSKTLARTAEQNRRRELEQGFNNFTDTRQERIRVFSEVAEEFFKGYKLRLPNSAVFADYAINHLKRLLGSKMMVDFNEAVVIKYQNDRLDEGTAPKTINEEVGFLLRILGEPGDIIRARLRKKKMLKLKVRKHIGKAYLNAGMRDAEIKSLSWEQINFQKRFLAVGRAKTEGGEGRTIPLNSELFAVLTDYVDWYKHKFGEPQSEWFVFPFGKPQPTDPTRHVTSLKTVWNNVRKNAGVKGRWHDNRHTLITELAESGAGDQTIMDIAGHVSKQMLKHYSHIRMEAKRNALETVVQKRAAPATEENTLQEYAEVPANAQGFEGQSLQKPLHSPVFEGHRGVYRRRKSLKRIGSSGRTRTYNPSVNSRMLCH